MPERPNQIVMMALEAESAAVFEQAALPIVFCGVGKINAAIAASMTLAPYVAAALPMPLIVNFGSVGSRRFPPATLVECNHFYQRDMDARALGFELGVTPYDSAAPVLHVERRLPHLPSATCGSGDSFATTALEMTCDVVDMEAYAIAKACARFSAPFACFKYVTDNADQAAAGDWSANVHKAAEDFLALFNRMRAP